jgi:hypothetical protein
MVLRAVSGCLFGVSLLTLVVGCGFYRYWVFMPDRTDVPDKSIPGWEVRLRIERNVSRPPPDSNLTFYLVIQAARVGKRGGAELGLDSAIVVSLGPASKRLQRTLLLFPEWDREPQPQRQWVYEEIPSFSLLPERVVCTVHVTLLWPETGTREQMAVDYVLHFKEVKRFWIGD